MKRIRLLPVTILVAILMFGVKLGNVWQGAGAILIGGSPAEAQSSGDAADGQAASEKEASAADAEGGGNTEKAASGPEAPDAAELSSAEVEILESLASRRAELDRRGEEIQLRENLLGAAEKRIETRITELKEIERTIQGLLRQHDEQEQKQLESLVKIYEKMKPKDAARIFNQLEMAILLDVVERMKESKMAPVLAAMDERKANELTVELATRRMLPGEKSIDGAKEQAGAKAKAKTAKGG